MSNNATEEPSMNVEQVARVAHEANRAYCESIGDTSQVRWEDAPQWQRDSALKGVQFHADDVRPRRSAAAVGQSRFMARRKARGGLEIRAGEGSGEEGAPVLRAVRGTADRTAPQGLPLRRCGERLSRREPRIASEFAHLIVLVRSS